MGEQKESTLISVNLGHSLSPTLTKALTKVVANQHFFVMVICVLESTDKLFHVADGHGYVQATQTPG